MKEIRQLLPDSPGICFLIPGLFNKKECEELLENSINASFQSAAADYPSYYRNNERLVIDDDALAGFLFEKVQPYLPQEINITTGNEAEQGHWKLSQLNSRLRFCRYAAHQYFHRHLDGVHYRSATEQSKLTFMIYLNGADAFKGGRTLFYRSKEDTAIWAAYTPVCGDLIVFDHNLWHEGEVLESGEKYVLRSDILYTRSVGGASPQPYSGHLGYIWQLLQLDEHTLLSGGRDKQVRVWDKHGICKQVLYAHDKSVLCLEKMGPDVFLSGSRDRQIKRWQRQADGMFYCTHTFTLHTAAVLSLCRLTAQLFASAGGDNSINIVKVDGTVVHRLTEHTSWVWQVIPLYEGHFASCAEDGTIKIWQYETGHALKTFAQHSPAVCLCYDSNANVLISGHLDGTIVFTSPGSGQVVRTIQAHSSIVRTLLLLDGDHLASGAEDSLVKIWDLRSQTCVRTIQHQNFVQSLVCSKDGLLLSASYDGTIKQTILPFVSAGT
jgi:hypothetical protein